LKKRHKKANRLVREVAGVNIELEMPAAAVSAEPKPPEPATSPSPDPEIGKLREALAAREKEAAEFKDKYLRSVADLDNFRKRSAKERMELINYKNEDLCREILPVMDNLDRAIGFSKTNANFQSLLEGVDLTLKQFLITLDGFGVKQIQAIGKPFDPNFHEAIERVQREDLPDMTVVSEHLKGYTMKERVLRPSKVGVSSKPVQVPPEGEATPASQEPGKEGGNGV
jgi:molecular chaperone GrpE